MAAAEYFNPGSLHPGAYTGAPRPPTSMVSTPPYPLSDAPPPYSAIAGDRPHSQPPPSQRPPPLDSYYPPPSNGQQYPPNGQQYPSNGAQYNLDGQQYPPAKDSRPPPQAQYRPQSYTQQPQQGYFAQPGPSSMKQSFSRDDRKYATNMGYAPVQPHVQFRKESPRIRSRSRSRDRRDRDRSRSRSRERHRKHHRQQPEKKKTSGLDTFVGAGGGALIGDAIFPGLGTIGGAILGGLGGRKVGKEKDKERRTHSNPNNMRGRSYSNDGDYYYADDYRRGRKY